MKIAYICTGLNPVCSGKVGCFKQQGAVFDDSTVCTHTMEPKYAKNDICEDPEALVGKRFTRYVMPDGEIRYFEIVEDSQELQAYI